MKLSASKVWILVLGLAAWMQGATSLAQERAQDRQNWIGPGLPVSDDPRHVPVKPGPHGPEGSIVLVGGRVFDGTGTAVREGTVLIERNRIKAVLPAGSREWPADARVIDVAGKTVMPGLIDLHTHLTYTEPDTPARETDDPASATLRGEERLRTYIESGITSVRDLASDGTVPFRLKKWVADNRIPGPRVFAAGQLITGTGGHGAEKEWWDHCGVGGERDTRSIREASGPDDWREAVREQFKRGADLIKLASHFSREEVKAAVDEAHALGLKVTVDAETFYIQWAVEAGVDSVEHPLPRTDETIRLMAKRHVDSVPTLVPYIYIFDLNGGYFGSTSRRFDFSKEANLEMFRRLKRAGVRMGVGTDLVTDWFRYLPQAYITELKQFVAGGFSIPEALVAATRTSAQILGMDDKLGTIEAGKLADVLVVDGRPDSNLDDLARVSLVIRDGSVVVENGRIPLAPHVPEPEPKATERAGTLADYQRAAVLQNARSLVFRTSLMPNWIGQGDRFWYADQVGDTKSFVLVDPDRNTQQSFPGVPATALPGEVLSPDGRWAVSLKAHNLWVRDTRSGGQTALTTDGEPHYEYASQDGISSSPITDLLQHTALAPEVHFSPDSRRLLTYRIDAREVKALTLVETRPAERPVTHTFRYPLAGDAAVAKIQMLIVDLPSKAVTLVHHPPFPRLTSFDTPVAWNAASTEVGFVEEARGFKQAYFRIANASTGEVRTPITEVAEKSTLRKLQARFVGGDVVWASERDGWNHLYLVDSRTGAVKHQLTRGEWVVRDIKHVDERRGLVYFTAGARESVRDPYYRHLYRVRLDGTGLQLLTPEPADHEIAFAPSGRYFIDTYSRIDLPPRTVLRTAAGRTVRELQRADISRLLATGWRPPEPFKVKARDGVTDLYGAIFRPSHFDPSKRYPVLDGIYPGPQIIRTAKSFDMLNYWHEDDLALAELGFIVVTLDGSGTPWRSRAFRERSYGKMGDGGGLEDHIAALEQLAALEPAMDLQRVGIYGHSGGGYAAVRAMLKFPEFYKVGVASSGNYDQRTYWAEWGERFQGYPVVGSDYEPESAAALAPRLQGRLLLAYGDLDDNVPPANTLQLVNALIAASRDFDLLVLPNRNHSLTNLAPGGPGGERADPYFLRRRWDYFVQHLMGVTPPPQFVLPPPGQ